MRRKEKWGCSMLAVCGILFAAVSMGCLDDGTSETTDTDQSYTYSATKPYVKLGDGKTVLTLTGVNGKSIIYANVNEGSGIVAAAAARVVESAKSRSATGRSVALSNELPTVDMQAEPPLDENSGKIRDFVPPQTFDVHEIPQYVTGASRSALSAPAKSVTVLKANDLTVGTAKKTIYVDTNVNLSSYTEKTLTLRAKASDTSGNVVCLLWVDKDCFTDGSSSGKQINSAVAEDLAETFASHYLHERSVFGSESDKILTYSSSSWQQSDMSSNSETGTYVNIVVYDIGADYGAPSQCGVVGYFYAKDYYETNAQLKDATGISYPSNDVRLYSNGGKYFYVDAAFCNLSGVDSNNAYTYDGVSSGTKASDTVISTLVHEFQHMIDFNQKTMSHNLSVETWYNEMLSMMAEDMMQTQLGTSNSEAPRGARLPAFNQYYYLSGITDYLSGGYAVLSYSSAYAFGAWVARTYGGPELISKMSQNGSQGMDSVLAAISSQTGKSLTVAELMEQYIQACVFRTTFANTNSLPTFYKNAGNDITTSDACKSSMSKINLFGSDYGYTPSTTKYYGPILAGKTTQVNVRPHGFVIHAVGKASSDTVELTFSPQMDSNEAIYVFVQDSFNNTEADSLAE